MEKRLTMLMVSLFLCVGSMLAQTKVSGTVLSQEDGQPIIGAAVKVDGTSTGMLTDVNGRFSLTLPDGKTQLTISYLGYESQTVTAKNNMRVFLKTDAAALDEVIVVAYGSQKKSSFTGSASTVKGENLEKLQVSNLGKALEGSVAGVQITSESGSPGSAAKIRIRGIGSINASQEPLIVVDGVPFEGSLNSIPTQDIESMTILKDAAANSMYGARGSNGVIMITTKSGKTGKVAINFDARYGFNTRGVPNYDIISDPGEYYEMMYESYRNSLVDQMGYAGASQYAAEHLIDGNLKYNIFKGVADNELIDPLTGKLNPKATQRKWNDDWTKDPFENGTRQEYTANFTGGSESTKAFASIGYLKDEGYMVGSGFERYNGRVKVDQNIGKNIRVGGNIAYSHTDYRTFGDTSSNYSNIFMFTQQIAPIYPIYLYKQDGSLWLDDNGKRQYDWGTEYTRPYSSEQNPLAAAEANIQRNERDNVNTRGYFEWTFLNDFKFTANVAYDVFNTWYTELMTPIGGDAKNVGGRGYKETARRGALNVNELLDWNHAFGKHGVHVLLGHENKNDKYRYMYGHMTQFSDVTNPEFANAAQYQELTSYTWEYALEGYFAKGEYNYDDKYYFTASIRRDGSSRFGKDNRWGTFWAIGASWRLKEEAFLKDVKWLSNLKVKASYGTQGNDNAGLYHNYSDLYRVDRVDGSAAFTKYFRGNPDLTWEKSRNFNVGFEAGFWKRLNIGFDFFIKETRDMLYQSPLAASEGNPSYIYRNEMNMKNTGFEVEISGDIIKTKDVTWSASLNLTHYKNKLTRLPDSKPASEFPDGYQAGRYWRSLDGSLYDWYRYEYVGVDKETGKPLYNHYTYETDPLTGKTLHEGYTYETNATGGFVYVNAAGERVNNPVEKDGKMVDENDNPVYKHLTSIGTGEPVIKLDANGNPMIDLVNTTSEATLRKTGKSAIPDLTGGFTTSVSAYGFDLSISTAFQLGGWVWDYQYAGMMNAGDNGENFHKDMFNRWTPAHTDTNIPALFFGSQSAGIDSSSDFFLTKGNYFSLRNVTLGYTIPQKWIAKSGITNLRVYLTGDNIWFVSKRKGFDPRYSFDGYNEYSSYSALSSYSVGVNVSF